MSAEARTRVYLDHAATTPVDPEVAAALTRVLSAIPGNPSSLHAEGREARRALEEARARIAEALGAAHPDEIVLCGSGTESDNLAVRGIAAGAARSGRGRHVVVSSFEHHAVLEAAATLEEDGFEVTRVAPRADGGVHTEDVAAVLRPDTALVSVMHSNNEIGTLADVRAIAGCAHAVGAYVHTDAAQSLGKVPFDVRSLGVDAASFAAHKLYAPKGAGMLYLRAGTPCAPLIVGGGQERGLRSGTQAVTDAVAIATALDVFRREGEAERGRLRTLRDRLEAWLTDAVDEASIHGGGVERLPHVTNIAFGHVDGNMLTLHLDEAGFAVSTGSACAGGAGSHVLRAIGADPRAIDGSIRISLGRWTSDDDVERFAAETIRIVRLLRSR